MMKSKLGFLCFSYALIYITLNFQGIIAYFLSSTVSQLFAYANLGILIFATTFYLKQHSEKSSVVYNWLFFYVIYYIFGLMASIRFNYFDYILMTVVQIVYFFTYAYVMGIATVRAQLLKVLVGTFFVYNFFTIFLFHAGINIDIFGTPVSGINRADGLIGDANNSAMIAIIGYILLHRFFHPKKIKKLRLASLLLTFYALVLTFSTTGLFVFTIVILFLNHRFFNKKRLVLMMLVVPICYLGLINVTSLASHFNLNDVQLAKVRNIENLLSFNLENVDSSGRDSLVLKTMEYIYENPILGNGIGLGASMRSHNTLLNIWADSGILALIAFLVVYGTYFTKAMKLTPNDKFYILSILITLLIFMFSLQTVINQPYLIVLLIFVGYAIDTSPKRYNLPQHQI